MLNVTSICGTPRGAAGMPSRRKRPSSLLSLAISRSPCRMWMSTEVWPSSAVVKTCVLRVGMVVLRSISLVFTPPSVSRPSESGVTSSSTTSRTSPASTPAWIAAPMATTSSGLTDWLSSLPVSFLTSSWITGMRVEPPTITTSSIFETSSLASASAFWNGLTQRSVRSCVSSSNLARVSVMSRCLGPFWSAVMKGRLIEVCTVPESSILAFSAASVRRWSAWLVAGRDRCLAPCGTRSPRSRGCARRSRRRPGGCRRWST